MALFKQKGRLYVLDASQWSELGFGDATIAPEEGEVGVIGYVAKGTLAARTTAVRVLTDYGVFAVTLT